MKNSLFKIDFLNDQNTLVISPWHFWLSHVQTTISCSRTFWNWIFEGLKCVRCFCNLKIWTPVTLNVFHVFPHYNIRKTFTVMHNPVLEHSATLSFALVACTILYINGKQFRCSVSTVVQYYRVKFWILIDFLVPESHVIPMIRRSENIYLPKFINIATTRR